MRRTRINPYRNYTGMTSSLGGHYAGTGMVMELDKEETYRNKSVRVKLTHDYEGMKEEEFEELCKSLSGEVTTYNVKGGAV